MSKLDIIEEIKSLSRTEQEEIYDLLTRLLQDDYVRNVLASINWEEEDRKMQAAAEIMLSEYLNDPELTIFTALDGEDILDESR